MILKEKRMVFQEWMVKLRYVTSCTVQAACFLTHVMRSLIYILQITPFNMREELEEGHFDADGHFQWNKDNDIKDNWLDNLDWVKVYKIKKAKLHFH